MLPALLPLRRKILRAVTPLCLGATTLLIASLPVSAQAACQPVNGHLTAQTIVDPSCPSPVGLCGEGAFSGALQGDFYESITSIVPSADTEATNVIFATGDITLHAQVQGKHGDLTIKDAFLAHVDGANEFTAFFSIIGGTDELSGATGILAANGSSNPATGVDTGDYNGQICLPQ